MIGKMLGHYEITSQLGKGGMGEVYVADDLNLNRKVALKFLPEAFAADPERMARFEREAKLLASLNHPNIAAIYGLEQAEGKRFLVLELVEGETLGQRLSKGPLPVEEALGICRQIAEGLEAAHEKGVIHRDLKPANAMITGGDKVKILDFGLAKALSDETQSVDSSQSPTLTEAMTRPGVILGTAAYMSPEQAKGKAVDKRADIWAFGCILYECLTGKRAFEGETVTETLASVLKNEPDWQALPATTPPSIRFVLRRCLAKNMGSRFHCVGDLRILIEEAPNNGEATVPVKRSWLAWSVATVAILLSLALAFLHYRPKPPTQAEPIRFQIPLPDKVNLGPTGAFAVSPDGHYLAFAGMSSDGIQRLWLHALDSLDARPLPGTESGWISPFFWLPDSRFIVFQAGGKLKRVDLSGGPPQSLCDLPDVIGGGSANRDGVIIFGDSGASNGIKRVSAVGGDESIVTRPNPERQETSHYFPIFLPDGRHFLYLISSRTPENSGIYIGSLDSKPEEQVSRRLLATNFGVSYIPSQDLGSGQILFVREQALMAQQFDEKQFELIGEPVPVAEQVGSIFGTYGYFSASKNGILVFRSSSAQFSHLTWFDRQGKAKGTAEGSGTACLGLDLSPDGAQAAISWIDSQKSTANDLWLLDFARGRNTRFTFGKGGNYDPIWSPDGNRIIFNSDRDGSMNLYQKLASGVKEEELLLKSSENKYPTSWSSDGRFLMYIARNAKNKDDLWVFPLEGDHKPIPFQSHEFTEKNGRFSPDMRWVAYESDESGTAEIYVQAFSQASAGASSTASGKWLVSKGGGIAPRWRGDNKELFYRAPDGKVMAVDVTAGTVFQAGTPKPLFQVPLAGTSIDRWDVASDGNRFLLVTPAAESRPSPFNVILNWTSLLKK
jgi:serine/threonine protein kinase